MAVNVTQNNTIVEVSGSQSTIEVNPTTSDIVVSGAGNTNVTIATAGAKGSTGEKGSSGSAGTSGTSGLDGTFFGSSGTSGTSGVDGVTGSSGSAGTSGTSGQDGTLFGSSGTSGVSGTNGTAGSGGTSGTNGTAGSSGTSGITQDLTSLNDFTSSIQTEVDGLSAATSSYLTELPSGTISGSSQITDVITDSYISSSAASSGFGSGGGDSHTHSNKTQLDTINQNLSTTSNVLFNDITASGDVTLSGSVSLNDNERITLGDSNDLKLHHTAGVNYIDGTATTIIRGNWLYLRKSGTTENFLVGKADGTVELYHNNDKKFETTADGIAMTGRITNLSEPTASQDAATKAYVDANSGGGGGSSLQSRTSISGSTTSIADTAEADLDITGFKSYMLQKVETSVASRVRLYTDSASRTADASRAEGTDPTSDSGLIAEVITTGSQAILISPGAFGFNDESTPTTTIPCRVTNKSGGASTVEVTLQVLQLEA